MQNTRHKTVLLAKMGLLAAIAVVCSLVHFPILPTAAFLEFELHDIPVVIGAFAFGPLPGLAIAAVSVLLDVALGIADTPPYGPLMHIISDGTIILVAGAIYAQNKTLRRAILSLIVGGLAMVAVMIPANLLITPIFQGAPVEAVIALLPTAIIPFNLLKALIVGVVVLALYKRISPFLKSDRWTRQTEQKE